MSSCAENVKSEDVRRLGPIIKSQTDNSRKEPPLYVHHQNAANLHVRAEHNAVRREGRERGKPSREE